MPNWCQNVATISHEDSEKIDAIESELKKDKDEVALFQMLHPRPAEHEENWYGWNVSNWGTKWDASVYDFERLDDNTIKITFDTAWGPCIALYEFLETEGYVIEGFYNEDGMAFCGCFRDGFNDDYNYGDYYSSEGILMNVPSDIDEMFGISERLADNEAEQEDEEDTEPEYETTEWFPKKIKPVHIGTYEVKTEPWPFPMKAQWDGKGWNIPEKVIEWRGITEAEHQMLLELEAVKKEVDELLEREGIE